MKQGTKLMIVGIVFILLSFDLFGFIRDLGYSLCLLAVGFFCVLFGYALNHPSKRREDQRKRREANARSRLNKVFSEAGYSSIEVDDMTNLAVVILKEGTNDPNSDWTSFGSTKLTNTVQSVMALKGKKPPIT